MAAASSALEPPQVAAASCASAFACSGPSRSTAGGADAGAISGGGAPASFAVRTGALFEQPVVAACAKLVCSLLMLAARTFWECVALFYPDCASNPLQGRHLDYHWDGARVDLVRDAGSGAVFRIVDLPPDPA